MIAGSGWECGECYACGNRWSGPGSHDAVLNHLCRPQHRTRNLVARGLRAAARKLDGRW